MSQARVSNTAPSPEPGGARIASVDALRGLVITLMVFVNDLAGAPHAPSWLEHVGVRADAMRLPDVVFPAFLFIAGVSVPLAFGRALARGRTRRQLLWKVLVRTWALLVMGVVMVNMEEHEPWARGLWGALAYVAMFLAFAVVPGQPGRGRAVLRIGRVVGAAALAALVLAYRTADGRAMVLGPLFDPSDTVWLRHSWWGILGLIGWAYLVASLLYLAAGRRRGWLAGVALRRSPVRSARATRVAFVAGMGGAGAGRAGGGLRMGQWPRQHRRGAWLAGGKHNLGGGARFVFLGGA